MYLTRKQHEALNVIDFPCSETFTAHYREAGFFVPGYMVRQSEQRLSSDVTPETVQLIAGILEKMDLQQKEIDRLRAQVNGNAFSRPPAPRQEPERKQGLNL